MTPTPEQSTIITAAASSGPPIMISAYAGCAKSSTLQMAAPGISGSALALAFNKRIADDLTPRLPENFTVKTLNALGHAAWSRTLGAKLKLDDRKLGKLVTSTAKDFRCDLTSSQWDYSRRLVSSAMSAGISPNNEGSPIVEDIKEGWLALFDGSSDDFSICYDIAYHTLKESITQARQGVISFDDQIYCPTILGGRWTRFPTILVDESQDLSPLNHRQLQLSGLPDCRYIVVGDSRQSIYAFRGADAASMENLRRLSPQWLDLPLTTTFRCPKVIVARQQSHAPGFTAWEGCAEGAVFDLDRFGEIESDSDVHWAFSHVEFEAKLIGDKTSMAVLCRNNAPLFSLAFKLLRRNIGCHMLGRDIGAGLKNLTNKLSDSSDSLSILPFISKLTEWYEYESSIARANDDPSKADRIADQYESLLAVIDGTGARTTGDLLSGLDNLFARSSGLITLSSIHRAKGLEFDLVIHLDPWRIPSKMARTPAQLDQERNLLYVAETRTRHTLLNLNLKDFR